MPPVVTDIYRYDFPSSNCRTSGFLVRLDGLNLSVMMVLKSSGEIEFVLWREGRVVGT